MHRASQDRDAIKEMLRKNYNSFYHEKLAEQQVKQARASELYNEKHAVIARNKRNRDVDYQLTAQQHAKLAQRNALAKREREEKIRSLEEIEQQMVSNLQNTLARKNDAIKTLKDKSRSLQKAVEPRMAYKYAPKENEIQQFGHTSRDI